MGGCQTDPHSQHSLACRRTFIPFAPFSGNTRIEQIRPYHQPRHSYQSPPALRRIMKNSKSVMSDETPTRDRNCFFCKFSKFDCVFHVRKGTTTMRIKLLTNTKIPNMLRVRETLAVRLDRQGNLLHLIQTSFRTET